MMSHDGSGRPRETALEDPEAYLRARDRRNQSPTPTDTSDSTAGSRSNRAERNGNGKRPECDRTRGGRSAEATPQTDTHERRDARGHRSKRELRRDRRRSDVSRHREDRRDGIDRSLLSHRSEGSPSKPYLDTLPGTYGSQQTILEWLDRLVSTAGTEGALSALGYYESIGWLSGESRTQLERFVDGFSSVETGGGSLGMSDHRESLAYIARLADRNGR